jgi:hypothetical protein
VQHSLAGQKQQIKQKETKLTKFFGISEFVPDPWENLRFLGYLLVRQHRQTNS